MMHFAMGYPGESGALARHYYHREAEAPAKPAGRTHGRQRASAKAKSQPLDPEDLRRRLYIVLAEQEERNKRRRVAADGYKRSEAVR